MALAHEYARQSLPTFTQGALEPNMKRFVLVSATAASLPIAPQLRRVLKAAPNRRRGIHMKYATRTDAHLG